MQRFQGLRVVSKDHTPERASTGLGPYLALEPRRKSKPRASTDPDRFWQIVAIYAVAVALIVLGFL